VFRGCTYNKVTNTPLRHFTRVLLGRKAIWQFYHMLQLPRSESLKQDGPQVAVASNKMTTKVFFTHLYEAARFAKQTLGLCASTPGTQTSRQSKPAVPAHWSACLGCGAIGERVAPRKPQPLSQMPPMVYSLPSILFLDSIFKGLICTCPAPRAPAAW